MARARLDHTLDVADENLLGLRGEVEDHVGVHRHEVGARILDALHDLLAAAVLVVAVHLLEQAVVEALHAYAQTLHATLQLVEITRDEVVRVRLARHFLDRERLAREIDGVAQLVKQDRRGAAADVEAVEIVAEVFQHEHFLAHVGEVRTRAILRIREAVERAIRAQPLTERHVRVQHVALARLGRGNMQLVSRLQFEVLLGALTHRHGQQSFR